jgi:predicted transcriptional regulator
MTWRWIFEIKGSKPATLRRKKRLCWAWENPVQWGMSNVLKVSLQVTIRNLADRGWSQRRIASELGIDRETVRRYIGLSKPAISIPGNEEGGLEPRPAISIVGVGAGRKRQCEPLAELIAAKVESGLSAQHIYQDLVEQNGFRDSYQSVRRFVRKLKMAQPQRVWRVEAKYPHSKLR